MSQEKDPKETPPAPETPPPAQDPTKLLWFLFVPLILVLIAAIVVGKS